MVSVGSVPRWYKRSETLKPNMLYLQPTPSPRLSVQQVSFLCWDQSYYLLHRSVQKSKLTSLTSPRCNRLLMKQAPRIGDSICDSANNNALCGELIFVLFGGSLTKPLCNFVWLCGPKLRAQHEWASVAAATHTEREEEIDKKIRYSHTAS